MKKKIGTILAVAGFVGLFCEAQTIGAQLLLTGGALAVFSAGVALLGGFKDTQPIKHISR